MISKLTKRHTLICLAALIAGSCERAPLEPSSGGSEMQFSFSTDASKPVPPVIRRILDRVGSASSIGTAEDYPFLMKISGSVAIDEARVLVLDCTNWENEQDFFLALEQDDDSLYAGIPVDPRKDVWDNLLAVFKGYRGTTYKFAGEYWLTVKSGLAAGVVNARAGLNYFFATLRESKQTVYLYGTITTIVPAQPNVIVLDPMDVVKKQLNNIAAWDRDSSQWYAIGGGVNGPVSALAVAGSTLLVGGSFSIAGTRPASNISAWDGTAWWPLGAGLNGPLYALAVQGTNVYAGGEFTTAGGTAASNIAMWNGSTWTALGSGVNGQVHAMIVDGTSIIVAGTFTTAGGIAANRVARWNGVSWSPLLGGTNGPVYSLALTGTGTFAAGGEFGRADTILGVGNVANWTGASWGSLGAGVGPIGAQVRSLAWTGSALVVGGVFGSAGGQPANGIARYAAAAWSNMSGGMNGSVRALAIDGADIFAGGVFNSAGGFTAHNIAQYSGTSWFPLGSGLDGPVNAIVISGRRVVVGGFFRYTR